MATIEYVYPFDFCPQYYSITVSPLPAPIKGIDSICLNTPVALTDSITGGTWSSSNTSIATIDLTSGIVIGTSIGTVNITYMLSTGCFTVLKVTVNPPPLPISGPSTVCVGATIGLGDPTPFGTWSSSNTDVATINSSGIVGGVSIGTTVISYTLGTGCFVTDTITVITVPVVGPISGPDSICVGGTTTFTDITSGGTWSSGNTLVATVDMGAGVVTGVALGTTDISYTVMNTCGSTVVTGPIYVIGAPSPPSPILGFHGVCSGSTETLTDSTGGGTWTSSTPTVATAGLTTGVVGGIASGTTTITYTIAGACGSSYTTTEVEVNMPPYITTNTKVACQSLAGRGRAGAFMLPDTGCILVCDSSLVRYYGNGNAGSVFTWVVLGGTVVTNYGDSIDVFWPTAGISGSIILYDTVSHCTGVDSACVQVIQRPHAYFGATASSICLGDNVIFYDSSSADVSSPIVSWNWSFGDGGFSSVENPTHIYAVAGTDTVTLVVKNACNCTDTFHYVITVNTLYGPTIECPSVACDSQKSLYTTTPGCSLYSWSIIGGTIVSGAGTDSIIVKWDSVGPDGFGYVRLAALCGSAVCSDTTTIKVPVILQNPVIAGPDTICAHQQYEYSFPLWPATQYMWGVLGFPAAIVGIKDDYKAVVQFDTPGVYTIHGWYQNRLKLCGANVDKTITVVKPVRITGPTNCVCQFSVDTFLLSDSTLTADWTLTNAADSEIVFTGGSSNFTYEFDSAGVYILSAAGNFCANPFTIVVPAAPAAIDSVSGPDTVCLNRLYSYTAYNNVPGTIYTWQITGGTVTPSSGTPTVTVVWTSTGTKQLVVSRQSILPPYCMGVPTTINIIQEAITPNITGDTAPCANSYRVYNSNYTRGEVYDWAIFPASGGSVVGGNHAPVMTALWNNVTATTAAFIVLTIHKCDSVVTDTFHLNIHTDPNIAVSDSPSTACPLEAVTFTASAGDSLYKWNFGDGSPFFVTSSNVTTHPFPVNTTTGNIVYTVKVTAIPGSGFSCPPVGSATTTVTILPGPVAFASAAQNSACIPDSIFVVGTVTDNVTGLTYQWYNTLGAITGATGSLYKTGISGVFYFTVTASNGCSSTSNGIQISIDSCGGTPLPLSCDSITASTSDTCTTVFMHGGTLPGGMGYQWIAETTPLGGLIPPGINQHATYFVPGIYHFAYVGSVDTCRPTISVWDTVGIVPDFLYKLACGTGGVDSVYLSDYSAYLPFWHIDTVLWFKGSAFLGGGKNIVTILSAPGTDTITEVVSGTRPGGTFTCDTSMVIVLPSPPRAAFTDSVSPRCENVPMSFTPTSTAGIIGYNWSFGDGASILLEYPSRTYSWTPTVDPHIYSVVLTVTDSIGCTADTTETVQIYENLLGGNLGLNIAACSNNAPIFLNWINTGLSTPNLWEWSNGPINTTGIDTVTQSGAYWVTVFDIYQCQATRPVPNAVEVNIIQTPAAVITGLTDYCLPGVIHLSGFAGSAASYVWYRDGLPDGTSSAIAETQPVGDYLLPACT